MPRFEKPKKSFNVIADVIETIRPNKLFLFAKSKQKTEKYIQSLPCMI